MVSQPSHIKVPTLTVCVDFFPIPGTTNLSRVDENLGSLKIKLSKEEEQEIRKACEEAESAGGRYPEAFASALFADTKPL
jgi:diketogulonate reductase-like aldo/keto reductase